MAAGHLMDPTVDFLADLGWGADQEARWAEAVEELARVLEQDLVAVDRTRFGDFAAQGGNGELYPPPANLKEQWGATRALLWLARRAESDTSDVAARRAAIQLATELAGAGTVVASRDTIIQAGALSAIEGLVVLARATGDREFLDTAERMAAALDDSLADPGASSRIDDPGVSGVMYTDARHTRFRAHEHQCHSHLEATAGLVDLHAATGNARWLEQAMKTQAAVLLRHQWASGGIPEICSDLYEHNDETCAVVSWLKLNLKLAEATGRSEYADVAEWVLLNHLYFDQSPNGGFCSDRSLMWAGPLVLPNAGRVGDECCSMHGVMGLLAALGSAVALSEAGLDIRLYLNGEVTVTRGESETFQFLMDGAYADSGTVRLTWASPPAQPLRLRFRRPAWLDGDPIVRLNGETIELSREPGYVCLLHQWKWGDVVTLDWPWRLALVESGRNGFNAPRITRIEPGTSRVFHDAVLVHGPKVLMLDRSLNPHLGTANDFAVALVQSADEKFVLPTAGATALPPGGALVHAASHFTAAVVKTPDVPGEDMPPDQPIVATVAGPGDALLVPLSEATVPKPQGARGWQCRLTYVVHPDSPSVER